jgi:hypothetical protein
MGRQWINWIIWIRGGFFLTESSAIPKNLETARPYGLRRFHFAPVQSTLIHEYIWAEAMRLNTAEQRSIDSDFGTLLMLLRFAALRQKEP